MLVMVAGCQNTENKNASAPATTEVAQQQLSSEDLGELGAKIQKNPNDAQQLLSQHGLTEESFQTAVRKVAENPEESKKYAAAFKRAS